MEKNWWKQKSVADFLQQRLTTFADRVTDDLELQENPSIHKFYVRTSDAIDQTIRNSKSHEIIAISIETKRKDSTYPTSQFEVH